MLPIPSMTDCRNTRINNSKSLTEFFNWCSFGTKFTNHSYFSWIKFRHVQLFSDWVKTVFSSMFVILLACNPFKISGFIVQLISIFVINFRQLLWVRNVGFGNKSMDRASRNASILPKIDNKVARHFIMSGLKPFSLMEKRYSITSISTRSPLLRVTPHLSFFRNCIQTFKPFNIFHLFNVGGTTACQKLYLTHDKLLIV